MVHLGTVIVGSNFNIFFEWADEDLHNLLYNRDIAKRHRQPDRVFAEAGDLANAVNFLHKHIKLGPCYHMDLKPENIVVRRKKEEPEDPIGRWMIADFGISAIHEDVTGSKTTAQRYEGAFQPPEIDESWGKRAGGINEKGDIWALGCILCMVLAFTVGGKDAVERLKVARAYNAVGKQPHDFFYVLISDGDEKKMTLKRSVRRWLTDVQTEMHYNWVSECVRLIHWILNIEQEDRPDAKQIEKELENIVKTYLGLSRQATEIPEHVTDSRNISVRLAAQTLQGVTQPTGPTTHELATGGRLGRPFNIFGRRKDSAQQPKNEIVTPQLNRLSTSTSPSEQKLKQSINRLSPSSSSSSSLRLRDGTTHNLDVMGTLRRKTLAGEVAICPMASRVLVCLKDKTVLLEREQNQYRSNAALNACEHACIAGPYYALQGVGKEHVSFYSFLLETWATSAECFKSSSWHPSILFLMRLISDDRFY
jgi:serine/threonine protein kinase